MVPPDPIVNKSGIAAGVIEALTREHRLRFRMGEILRSQ
jgi:hypothetical protein